jgi:hypothetical protein
MADQPGVNVQLVHFRSFDVVKIVFLFRQFFGRSVHLVDDHDGRSTVMPCMGGRNQKTKRGLVSLRSEILEIPGIGIAASEKSAKNDTK